MRLRRVILLLAMLEIGGCGTSPQTNYFTLATLPAAPAVQEKVSPSSPVTVAAVHVPPSLDRREMVRRTGPNSVEISDQDRWTASLGEMTRRVLSQDLVSRLRPDSVILPDAPVPPDTMQIIVTIAQFGPDAGGKVTLSGSWSLLKGRNSQPVLHREIALETAPSAPGGSGEAAAMSQLLGQLADRIAATLNGAK